MCCELCPFVNCGFISKGSAESDQHGFYDRGRWIFCAKWFSQVMVKLFHKTPNDNIWRDVLDLRNGSNLKLYIREEDYYVVGHHRNIEEKGDDSWIVLTGFVKLNKSDDTELESHKEDNKSMIAIRLVDVEYAEIFN